MKSSRKATSSNTPAWAQPVLAAAALAAVAFAGGCTVHVHDREREQVIYREPVRQPTQVVAEVPPPPAPEPVQEVVYEPAPVEVVTEYEPTLQPYGRWVVIERYGRCWVYNNRPVGWRPYTRGHWVASDEGWLWVAEGDEASWGQTCYHYGRWYQDAGEGWVWVPGRVWAPSWCAWREGGGYSSWAPLPPECGDGHLISTDVVERHVRREDFVCVQTRNITNVHIEKTVIVNNVTIVNKTVNVTNITYVNNRAVNRGVSVEHVQAATGKQIRVNHTTEVKDVAEARRLQQQGKQVIYTPPAVKTFSEAHPVQAEREKALQERKEAHAADIEKLNQQHIDHKDAITDRKVENRDVKDQVADDKAAAERAAKLHNAEEKAAMEKAALEHRVDVKADTEKARLDREASERANREKMAQEKIDIKNNAEKAELDRKAQEKASLEQQRNHEKLLQEKAASEKAALDRKAEEKAAEKRDAEEKVAKEKAAIAEERTNREKMAQEKLAADRAAEKAAVERKAEEKAAAEKAAADARAEKLRIAEDKAAAEKAAREAKNGPKAGTGGNTAGNNPNDPNNPNNPKKKRQPGDQTPSDQK